LSNSRQYRLTLQDRLDIIRFCEKHLNLTDEEAAWALCRRSYSAISEPSVWRMKKQKSQLHAQARNLNDLSFKRSPLIIGCARRPRAFDKKNGQELGYGYWWSTKARMVGSVWQG
jgi:hypothetical protein